MMRGVMKKTRILVTIVLLIALLSSSAMAASYGAKVLTSSMSVYAKPSVSEKYLGSLSQGESFTVLAISGEWALVRKGNNLGYARLQDIIFSDPIKAIVTKDTNLYYVTKASYKQGISYQATASVGLKVYVAGFNGDYLLVTNESGTALGYIKASCLKKL